MKIRSILATGAIALAVAGGSVSAASASTTHVRPVATATATGSVALSGPIQYVSFNVIARSGYRGWIDYANFTYPAANTNVWNISGTHLLTFAGTYAHTMTVTTVTPQSTHSSLFSGTGTYNADSSYTWTVSGTVNWNSIWFSIVYTGTNAGYRVSGHGWIAANGSVSGTARDSNGLTLPFTMPAGSAFQVLRYQAPVTWAVISGHNARFGFTIPSYAPAALAGLPIVVKVHDGGTPGSVYDTYAHGVATSWHNGPVTQYPITSGNIVVRR
jgi:hypothetical protein